MAKSAVDIALANIDADIASLQRSKEIILAAVAHGSNGGEPDAPKVKRTRKKKAPGLPADADM